MKIQKNHKVPFMTLALLLASGCEQNPFPDGTKLTKDAPPVTEDRATRPGAAAFVVDMPDLIECHEGLACEALVTTTVAPGYTPKLTFNGLPAGSSFDIGTGTLTYTPGFDTIDLQQDPTQKAKKFSAEVLLTAAEAPSMIVRKKFTLVVYNVLRPVALDFGGVTDFAITEGQQLSVGFSVQSPDFPNGPFGVALVGQPVGMKLEEQTEMNRYSIEYRPDRRAVTVADSVESDRHVKLSEIKAYVVLPSGDSVSQSLKLKVTDDRAVPLVTGVKAVRGSSISFTIRAEDLNGEVAPLLQSQPSVPYGRLQVTETSSRAGTDEGLFPFVTYEVIWDQIPSGHVGEVTQLRFLFCTAADGLHCGTHSVKATVGGGA